jgi:hypothetical protein
MNFVVRFKGGPHDGETQNWCGSYVPDVIRLYVPQTCFPADWRPPSRSEQVAPTMENFATYRLQLWRDDDSEWYEGTYVETT